MSERALLDTNVLVYAMHPEDERHKACFELVDATRDPSSELCIAPRNLAEFYRVVTDPRKVPEARTVEQALGAVEALLSRSGLEVLPVPTDLVSRWVNLVRHRPVTGARLFDVILVATMLGNDITQIYTYNRRDFEPFEQLNVRTPGE